MYDEHIHPNLKDGKVAMPVYSLQEAMYIMAILDTPADSNRIARVMDFEKSAGQPAYPGGSAQVKADIESDRIEPGTMLVTLRRSLKLAGLPNRIQDVRRSLDSAAPAHINGFEVNYQKGYFKCDAHKVTSEHIRTMLEKVREERGAAPVTEEDKKRLSRNKKARERRAEKKALSGAAESPPGSAASSKSTLEAIAESLTSNVETVPT